jgi:hypothetical protein
MGGVGRKSSCLHHLYIASRPIYNFGHICSVLLRMRNVSDKIFKENKNTF